MSISQGIIALLEGYIISGSFNNALLYGGSTYISSAVSTFIPSNDELYTKQVIEPLRAALLAMAGQYVFPSKLVKEGGNYKYLKTAAKAFIITGSSAGLDQLVNKRSIGGSSYAQATQILEVQRQNNLVGSNVVNPLPSKPSLYDRSISNLIYATLGLGALGITGGILYKTQSAKPMSESEVFEMI